MNHEEKEKNKGKKGAPKENQFWKLRATHGRPKIFTDPEQLWHQACKYFQWCDDNPLKEEKLFGTGYRGKISLKRAYTMKGLCFFIGIGESTWNDYKNKPDYKDFSAVIEAIEQAVYTQKFEGAAVGLFNANIIARDLGLADKLEANNTNRNSDITEEDVDSRIEKLLKRLGK